LSYGHPDFNVLSSVLESESNVLINWFKVNKMQANPEGIQNQWTYHRPKVYPIKYHGVGNQMPWKDSLGLWQHTDFCQGHSAHLSAGKLFFK
jgi:hypothetical protein